MILWVSGALMAGVYAAEYLGFMGVWGLLCIGITGVLIFYGIHRGMVSKCALLFPLAFSIGVTLWTAEDQRFLNLDPYGGRVVEIQGLVYGLEDLGNSLRMTSAVIQIDGKSIPLERDIRLRFKNEQRVPKGLNGDRIVLRTSWQLSDTAMNPRGFDYQEYLNRSGFQNELRISPWQIVSQEEGVWSLRKILYAIRTWYGVELLRVVPLEEGSVAYGMAIGDTVLIPKDLMNSYRISGLGHLLSVSGLHFAILYDWLRRALSKTPLRESRRMAIIIGILTFMGFLNGWTAPALRAWGMILLLILSKKIHRQYDGLTALSAIAILTTVVQPLAVLQPGFQFSYGAVLGLMTLTRPLERLIPIPNSHLREYLAASIAVQGAVVPLGIFWFGFWNPITLIVNFPVMVLSEWLMPVLVLFPLLLLLGPAGEGLLRIAIGGLVGAMNACSEFMVDQAQDWLLPSPTVGQVLGILLLILIASRLLIPVAGGAAKRGLTNRVMLTLAVIVMGIHLSWIPNSEITFFAVGQGDGALVRFEDQNILIDAGPRGAKLDRLLLRNGITQIDSLVITHGHEDHIGGAVDILKHLRVGAIVIGTEEPDNPLFTEMVSVAHEEGVPVKVLCRGDWLFNKGERELRVLYPFENKAQDDLNAHSLTLLYSERGFNVLFTGDQTKAGEEAMMAQGLLPDIDFLKVPHHGSLTSNSGPWLETIRPETGVISVGPNLYGLPNHAIIDGYRKAGVTLYRTDDNGAVRLTLSGNRRTLKTWR